MILLLFFQFMHSRIKTLNVYHLHEDEIHDNIAHEYNHFYLRYTILNAILCSYDCGFYKKIHQMDAMEFVENMISTQKQYYQIFYQKLALKSNLKEVNNIIEDILIKIKTDIMMQNKYILEDYEKLNDVRQKLAMFSIILASNISEEYPHNAAILLDIQEFFIMISEINIFYSNMKTKASSILENINLYHINYSFKNIFRHKKKSDLAIVDINFLLIRAIDKYFIHKSCSYEPFKLELEKIFNFFGNIYSILKKKNCNVTDRFYKYEHNKNIIFLCTYYMKSQLKCKLMIYILCIIGNRFKLIMNNIKMFEKLVKDNKNQINESRMFGLLMKDLHLKIIQFAQNEGFIFEDKVKIVSQYSFELIFFTEKYKKAGKGIFQIKKNELIRIILELNE